MNGNSNYAFPLILKKKSMKQRDNLEKLMTKKKELNLDEETLGVEIN